MSKKIVAVNSGPRMGRNTETLISDASRGAESAGATVERFDLFRLDRYTGCISCFGCKKEKFKSILINLIKEAEYHNATADLPDVDFWHGEVNKIRFDYFTGADKGDTMYIRSFKLSSKQLKMYLFIHACSGPDVQN